MSLYSATGAVRRMAILGNHIPRQCGIATFTADLRSAVQPRGGAPGRREHPALGTASIRRLLEWLEEHGEEVA